MIDDDDGKTVFQPAAPKKDVLQFAVGDILSEVYEIKRFIARGGMGEVYEAVNIHHREERVAIKVMLPEFAADERVIAMFAKEAGTLTRLHHEAIVPYRLASRDKSGRPYIVTAYVDGPSLEDLFESFSPTEDEFGRLARRLAKGLGKAHELGAIHRDIAPDNVLLVDGDPALPKIIDFGIAQDARAGKKGATIIGDGFAGKLNYVAPEQLGEYNRKIGPWTDLYSLALTLLAVASQKHANMGGSIASSVKKRMSVPDLSAIPARYRAAFTKALQPDPKDRPQSMAAFVALLDKPISASPPIAKVDSKPAPSQPAAAKAQPTPEPSGVKKAPASGFAPLTPETKPEPKAVAKPKLDLKAAIAGKEKLFGGAAAGVLLIAALTAFLIARPSSEPLSEPGPDVIATGPDINATDSSVTDPPDPKEVANPEDESKLSPQVVDRVASGAKCAWLSDDTTRASSSVDPDNFRFVGGVGNTAFTSDVLAKALTRRADKDVVVDLSDVVEFDPRFCSIIEAIKSVRSDQPIISSPDKGRMYEVEVESIKLPDMPEFLQRAAYPNFKVSGIAPDETYVLLALDTLGKMSYLANGREHIEKLIEIVNGTITADGFNTPFRTSMDGTQEREGYGFIVIAGRGELPESLFGNANRGVPLNNEWGDAFIAMASARGWRSDIYWYSLVDEVKD